MSFNEIEVALAAVAKGGFVVVADDASRENEGDLIIAAEKVTRQALSFMLRLTRVKPATAPMISGYC